MQTDLIIVGGGASGLFCAVQAAWLGNEVILIEHERHMAQKLNITGKGRCNVTNNCDVQTCLANIPQGSRFLYSALSRFSPEDTMAFFESLGVPLKTERGNRVFPQSDNAHDISNALINAAKQAGVRMVRDDAQRLLIDDGEVRGVKCAKGEYFARSVALACGGLSYPKTGSTGDGFKLARQAGHHVSDLCGSLVPVELYGNECAEAMGLSLKNCSLTVRDNTCGRDVFSDQGEMLFTHFGMSGPLVLSASAHMNSIQKGRYSFIINLKPALDDKRLDERILRDFAEVPNRIFSNSLSRLLPASIIPVIIRRSGIDPNKKVNQITRDERMALVAAIHRLTFEVKGLRPVEEAIITRGGVDVREISPKTMESKLVKGLHIIGEMLDCDGYTGGFNLQIAFSTAYACAASLQD
ncbi:MAG: NAD(P)/FAD-dependent oxidoreductase [Ruminococcus sp.]|nr:NAD(P)/FAD-dependent oxidoreductase [Ruminococcus sp.]